MLTSSGIASIRNSCFEAAATLSTFNWYTILKVGVPAAMPHKFIGLFNGTTFSFITLATAEMLGAKYGMGWDINWQGHDGLCQCLHGVDRDEHYLLLYHYAAVPCAGQGAGMAERSDQMVDGISISGVGKHFTNPHGETVTALSDINLQIRPGSFVSLIGPSGCWPLFMERRKVCVLVQMAKVMSRRGKGRCRIFILQRFLSHSL